MSGPYDHVVLTSGHMIDAPGREHPRFPAHLEPSVAARIEQQLDEWEIGPDDLLICGGARGADILFAESAHRRGTAVEIVLALPPDEFEAASVAIPDSIWAQRFRYLLRRYPSRIAPHEDGCPNEFAAANTAMIRQAEELAPPAALCVALVWDEQPAGGPGGTGEFADLARRLQARLAVINPTRL